MNNKLKILQRLALSLFYFIATIISLIPVTIGVIFLMRNGITIPDINFGPFITVSIFIVIIPILYILYIKLLKVKWARKLQALATADELGITPTSSVLFKRALINIEWSFPVIMAWLVTILFTLLNGQFKPLSDIFTLIIVGTFIWFIATIIIDYIKISYQNKNIIEREYKLAIKKDELYAKELEKKDKKAIEAAKLKKRIEDLESLIEVTPSE